MIRSAMKAASFRKYASMLAAILLLFICSAAAENEEVTPTDLTEAVMVVNFVENETAVFDGDIILKDQDLDGIGLHIVSGDGGASLVTVNGSIVVDLTTGKLGHISSVPVYIEMSGEDSHTELTVNGNLDSRVEWTDPETGDNVNGYGLSLEMENGSAQVQVNGDVTVTAHEQAGDGYTWAAGVHLYNTDGTADVEVNGDVTVLSDIYGVGLNLHHLGLDGTGLTRVKTVGDVSGATRAAWLEVTGGGKLDVIVDGTLRTGQDDTVLIDSDDVSDIRITCWKIEPDQEGKLLRTGLNNTSEMSEAEMEKNFLQYIIRVADESAAWIAPEAESYEGYLVGKEGALIPLSLSLPEGYDLTGVYTQENHSIALTPDENGNYILCVPRGGGVLLSVELEKKAPEPEQPKEQSVDNQDTERNEMEQNTATIRLASAEDTVLTAALRSTLTSPDELLKKLPEAIRDQLKDLPAGGLELMTLSLMDYAPASGSRILALKTAKPLPEGQQVTVLFLLPSGESFEAFLVQGKVRADGLLWLSVPEETLNALSGQVFLAAILI